MLIGKWQRPSVCIPNSITSPDLTTDPVKGRFATKGKDGKRELGRN